MYPIRLYTDKYDPENKYIIETEKYIIAQGGDGTLLKAISKYKEKNKPFFGIGTGTLNFLMNKEKTVSKKAKKKEFNLIKVKVKYKNLERDLSSIEEHYVIREKKFEAFNDIMLGGDMNSWISFDFKDKDSIIGKFMGGGVIISTAQGTTGINKNNNGVILPLSSKQWSITGDKTNRKIHYVIKPHKTIIECSSRRPITLWVDGQNKIIENVLSIEISKGRKVTVIFNNYKEFKKKRNI